MITAIQNLDYHDNFIVQVAMDIAIQVIGGISRLVH